MLPRRSTQPAEIVAGSAPHVKRKGRCSSALVRLFRAGGSYETTRISEMVAFYLFQGTVAGDEFQEGPGHIPDA